MSKKTNKMLLSFPASNTINANYFTTTSQNYDDGNYSVNSKPDGSQI